MRFLKKLRQSFDLSQEDLGAILGAPQNTFSRWERGQSDPPKEIRQLLADLGVNLHWLDTGEGDMLRPGVSLDVVVVDGRKQLRKTVRSDSHTSGGGSSVAESRAGYMQAGAANPVAGFGMLTGQPTPAILPSMVATAAEMVDAVIQAMPPERRPTDAKRWEAYALIARYLAEDKAEGKEGRARTFLLGLKAEWAEAPVARGV